MPGGSTGGRAGRTRTRHVWIAGAGFHDAPRQGLVVAWTCRPGGWSALCVWVDLAPDGSDQLIQRWVPADRLRPVRTTPEGTPGTDPDLSRARTRRPRPGDYPPPLPPPGRR